MKIFNQQISRFTGLAGMIASLAAPLGYAQNLDQVMPKPVPELVEPVGVAPPPPVVSASELADGLAAQPGEPVVISRLKGIRFVSAPDRVVRPFSAMSGPLEIDGVRALQNTDTLELVSLVLGRPVSVASLQRLQNALRLLLAQNGAAFSLVSVPPQDVTEGYLQVVVIESVVGAVRVEGNTAFPASSYLNRIAQTPGQPVDGYALNTGIERINQNSFRQAAIRVQAGREPGTTDIIVAAQDRFPWRFFTGYNNTGTRTTTEDRINAGVNWGNVFGSAHVASLQWTSDLEARYSRAVSGNYAMDLPRNHTLSAFGAYSEIASVPNGGISTQGVSWQVGVNYDIPLRATSSRLKHSLQFGTDFKASDNNIEFALPPFIIPISDNLTHVVQARVAYNGTLTDAYGGTSWGISVIGSPGGLAAENNDAAFNGSRSGAKATYAYGRLDATRQTSLKAILPGMNWLVRGSFQQASGNLLGSEQFSGGGASSVRGYEQGEVVGDNGFLLSQELQFPAFTVLGRLGAGRLKDSLSLYLFEDYAHLWNVDKLPGERPFNLHSVGVGLRYQVSTHGTLQLSQGWQLRDSGSNASGKNSRLHVSANLSF